VVEWKREGWRSGRVESASVEVRVELAEVEQNKIIREGNRDRRELGGW
jgi:hypothetical protein